MGAAPCAGGAYALPRLLRCVQAAAKRSGSSGGDPQPEQPGAKKTRQARSTAKPRGGQDVGGSGASQGGKGTTNLRTRAADMREEVEALRRQVYHHSDLYYNKATPEIRWVLG